MTDEQRPLADYVVELHRASSALSRANATAEYPYKEMIGALLDAVEALIEICSGESDG